MGSILNAKTHSNDKKKISFNGTDLKNNPASDDVEAQYGSVISQEEASFLALCDGNIGSATFINEMYQKPNLKVRIRDNRGNWTDWKIVD